MATSLHDIFLGHPLPTQTDVAYGNLLDGPDADQARKANNIGRDIGLPGATVGADMHGFEQEQYNNKTLDFLHNDPALTQFLTDPHAAASVKDDLPALSTMSSLFKSADDPSGSKGFTNYMKASAAGRTPLLNAVTLNNSQPQQDWSIAHVGKTLPKPGLLHKTPNLGDWLGGVASSFSGAVEQSASGAESYIADMLDSGNEGTNPVSDFLRRDVAQAKPTMARDLAQSAQVREDTPSEISKRAYDLTNMVTMLGASILTEHPIAAFGIQSGTAEYQKVRDRGGSPDAALLAGTGTGVATSAFQNLGLGWALGNFGKVAAGKFIGGLLLRDLPAQEAITASTNMIDALAPGGEGMEKFKEQLPQNALDTAISTVALVGLMGGAHYVAGRLSPEVRAADDIERANKGGEFLDQLMSAAEQSKTKAEDPETLRQFVEQRTQDSPVRNVYVPVEAAVKYMQSEKYGGELDAYKAQIDQAQATQGDVLIPIADAVAHLSGTPAWDALKDEVRIDPGGLSRSEALQQHGQIVDQLEQRGKEIANEVNQKQGELDASGEVYADVKNRLRLAGVDERQSDAIAQVYAARYEARAAQRGGTPMEQFKASKISFPGEQQGKPAGRKVATTPLAQDENGRFVVPREPATVFGETARDEIYGSQPIVGATEGSTDVNKTKGHLVYRFRSVTDAEGKHTENPEYLNKDGEWMPLENHRTLGDEQVFTTEKKAKTEAKRLAKERATRTVTQAERGATTFTDNGEKIISLFGSADRSTLLHETGHIWLEEMKADALAKDATEQDKANWETVKKWFADNGAAVNEKNFIPTAAHEVWARGVERHFMEGKAPSEKLAKVFRTFKAWLLKLYGVVQNLHTPITPEIRDVMDRLLATQEAIDDARRNNATEPLFKSAEDAHMTEAEFADYQKRVGDARDEAYDSLLYKTMESIRRQRTAEMRAERASVRADVAKQIEQQPQFRLLHLLRTGKWLGEPEREAANVKLNTGWLIDNYGEGILEKLPRGIQIFSGKGESGDIVAEMVGMKSGDEVVKTLVGMRAASDELRKAGETRSMRDKLVADETDRLMAEKHGDALTDGSIEEEAVAAINSARQGEIIASEARQLAKRKHVMGVPTPYQFAREWARRTVAAGSVRDVASRAALQRYIRASNKAARLAEAAILKGDVDEAYRQKQAQLLNHALLAEAKAAADRVDKIVDRMRTLGKRAAMKSVDPEYLDKVHMLLENYDFRPRSQRSIDEQANFQKWIEGQRANGFEVHIPPRLEDNGTPYSRVSVQELDSLNDLVESLIAVGRAKQKIKIGQEERSFAEQRDLMIAHLKQLPNRNMKRSGWKNGIPIKFTGAPINERASVGSRIASDFVKVEKLAEEMDGAQTGPWSDLLATGSRDAENKRHELRNMVLQPIADMYHSLGHKQWRRMQERVTIPELTWNSVNEGDPRKGTPVTVTRSELLAIFMNMGNLSNLEKLSRGERWPVETLKRVMDRELTKEDYDLAQRMWDQVGKLWSSTVETEREMSGVVPERVVNSPIATRFGTYEGGYWPVVYDPARWQLAEDIEGKQLDDMFGIKSGVATQKGHTITRTGAYGPINLSLERVLFNHIEHVITRNSYASFARDVLRVVRDRSIRGWIDTKLGSEYRKQIEPWLQQQITAGLVNAKAARWWEKVLRQFRINTQIAAMGFRHTVLLAQSEGLFASADRIGAQWVAAGMKEYARRPIDTVKFVLEKSAEMRFRNEAVTRETAEMSARMRGKHSWFTTMQNFALAPIGWADRYTVSVPTWMGAYQKAMSEGMGDGEAVAFADKSVRMSQGAGTAKDLSAVQARIGEGSRFFTMFYSPFNVMFNQQWAGVRAAKRGNPVPLLKTTFYWVVLTAMSDALMHGDWPTWSDPANIEKWFARNVFFGLWSGVPIARDLANWGNQEVGGQYAGDPGSTPVGRTLTAITKAMTDAVKWEKTGQAPKHPIKEAGNTAAVVGGLPISQASGAAQFLWDVHHGDADPKSVSDWYFGLTKGTLPKQKEEAVAP